MKGGRTTEDNATSKRHKSVSDSTTSLAPSFSDNAKRASFPGQEDKQKLSESERQRTSDIGAWHEQAIAGRAVQNGSLSIQKAGGRGSRCSQSQTRWIDRLGRYVVHACYHLFFFEGFMRVINAMRVCPYSRCVGDRIRWSIIWQLTWAARPTSIYFS
jgi:hypothetical protein